MLSILLPAARVSAPYEDGQACWGDLRVALASIAAYAPDVEVVVAWSGSEAPDDLPANRSMRLLRQPEGIRTGSAAWNWCAAQTTADLLLILGDDCVLHPDTVRLLIEDMTWLYESRASRKVGFLGARSNFVKGSQNIRSANDGQRQGVHFSSEAYVLDSEMIVPVAALILHEVFDEVGGFPDANWFADDLICWDLVRLGYTHHVSRAYVHHVGQRATGQGKSSRDLWDEGISWLATHRPDFLISSGLLPSVVR